MKERPILFSAPMVRAILEGRKSQTRRVVKPQPANDPAIHHPIAPYNNGGGGWNWVLANTGHGTRDPFPCPYGVPGDRLWVREACIVCDIGMERSVAYRADGEPDASWLRPLRWRPSIHMPRSVSRILLEVTNVRVERLQDISEADALAEGVDPAGPVGYIPASDRMGRCRYQYANLWDSINGAGSWAANPWVWAVSFRRLP